jgi:hypothetical protein
VFREKYPEVFSVEGVGEASLKRTYAKLSENPDMIPSFEKWVAAIWASYAENAKHTKAPPKPVVFDHKRQQRRHGGRSAAWVRLHSS